jgi:cell fate regulator YaaT (PSP1 superfamily)
MSETVTDAHADDKPEAMNTCREKIEKHGLDMKLIDMEYAPDDSKVIFYFTAENRVDFRELVKDMASTFHKRIELRQVGVRDEAKLLGGIGNCGRSYCCSAWLQDFDPVSIKMAKTQNLSLNPAKISGCCGRLMCCLKYENDVYHEMRKGMPNHGEIVDTPNGKAKVMEANILMNVVKVRLVEKERSKDEHEKLSSEVFSFPKEDIKRTKKQNAGNKKSQVNAELKEAVADDIINIVGD